MSKDLPQCQIFISPLCYMIVAGYWRSIVQLAVDLGWVSMLCFMYAFNDFTFLQQTSVAPAVSIASISSEVRSVRRNRCGSSFLSKYSPLAGVTGPRECPELDPGPLSPDQDVVRPNGPCCCAFCR
jgi:hypothetical protein